MSENITPKNALQKKSKNIITLKIQKMFENIF